ncbi:MAG: YolD-like family protein [Firmicutes bacterium]|nr:YolD-like family protein [Bacillota bacterium]
MKKKLYHQFACSCMMLPEHRARLARRRRENTAGEICRERALFADEQQLEQFQHILEQSMHSGLPVRITFIEKGECRTFTGSVLAQQSHRGSLRLRSEDGAHTVSVAAIVHLEAAPPQD